MRKYKQKKIAAINDISGYGRCSLTVSMPIISALKVQCCPVPTVILSNHTAYPDYFFDDYTEKLPAYIEQWKKLELEFDGILTGFLGSKAQIDIVIDFITYFKRKDTLVIVDPIMGDHGKAYTTYTPEMCQEMKRLVTHADLIIPNVTEACILTNTPYQSIWERSDLIKLAEQLHELGPNKIVISGIIEGEMILNLIYEFGKEVIFSEAPRVGAERHGTGDVFASIIAGENVKGIPLLDSVKKAENFVRECIIRSDELEIPKEDGVCFEELLYLLIN